MRIDQRAKFEQIFIFISSYFKKKSSRIKFAEPSQKPLFQIHGATSSISLILSPEWWEQKQLLTDRLVTLNLSVLVTVNACMKV